MMLRTILAGAVIAVAVPNLSALEIVKYNGSIAYLPLSEHSVNRIVFPSNVVTKVYSKEKGVNVVEKGNEVFVKWTPLVTSTTEIDQNGQATPIEEPKVDYSKAKVVDLFVTTENGTYSLVLQPSNIAQETIMISNPAEDQKKSIEFETKDPYVETMKKLVSLGFDLAMETPNGDLTNFKIQKPTNAQTMIINSVGITPKASLVGALFQINLYEIKNNTNKSIKLNEVMFNRIAVEKKLAISSYSNELFPFQRTALVIVSRNTTANGGDNQ